MGNPNDANAVVTTTGKVIGSKNLRIVDASTFPLLPPGHLLATVCKLKPNRSPKPVLSASDHREKNTQTRLQKNTQMTSKAGDRAKD